MSFTFPIKFENAAEPSQGADAQGTNAMSAESADQHAAQQRASDDPDAAGAGAATLVVERVETAAPPADRGFWGAFAVAAALHALILLATFSAVPRHVGEADGSADGISVSVVTESDLRSQSTVPAPAEPPPGRPAPAAEKPTPPAPEPVPQQQPQQETAAAPPPELAPEPAPEPVRDPPPDLKPSQLPDPEPTPKQEAEKTTEAALEKDVPNLLTLPAATAKPPKKETAAQPKKVEAAPKQQAQQQPPQQPQQKRVAKLDLTPPSPSVSAPSGNFGRRAGMERPPGITRSGANDEFARGVIRALQGTMPQLREVLGRVTVRITLNENGNVTDVQVVRTANNSTIDQSVVFAAKQTSYPFPPPNSNMADRTFLVTYIYH